jgi:hypothetical protein
VNDVCLYFMNDDENVARSLLAPESILTLGVHFVYLPRFELERSMITQGFSSGGTSAALTSSSTKSHSSTGQLQKVQANAKSSAGSGEAGAGMPISAKLCERFATAKESSQGVGLRMPDEEVTAQANDFAIFVFKFLLLVTMRCRMDG